jgi:hypothetical protein
MEREIFVVLGSTGEYSDRVEWIVAAFASEHEANERAANAKAEADRIFTDTNNDHLKRYGATNKFDDQMQIDYTGVIYGVIKIKLYE